MARTLTRARIGYEEDFHAWLVEQAALARAGRAGELDLANIAEELEALGRSERRELESRLQQILLHLWKLTHGPDQRSRRAWVAELDEQRDALDRLLRDSPSLRGVPAEVLGDCWRRVRGRLERATNARRLAVPEECPFAVEEVLHTGW